MTVHSAIFNRACPALFLGILLLLAPSTANSQGAEPAGKHAFDRQTWRRAIEGLDYPRGTRTVDGRASPAKGQAQGQDGETNRRRWLAAGGSERGKLLIKALIILGAAVILFVLLRGLLGLEWAPRNSKLPAPGDLALSLEKIEEDLEIHDLEAYIRQALSAGRLDIAVRLYYLQALRELSARRLIRWKRDRTNREYLRELQPTELYPDFAGLTLAFERTWYGQYPLSETDFRQMEDQFRRFLETIRRSRSEGAT